MKELAVIIPCNDSIETVASFLPAIIQSIGDKSRVEIIFADASNRPEMKQYIQSLGCEYAYAKKARRSTQCNIGAHRSSAPFLFFLHIDSILPERFEQLIINALQQKWESGCFRLKFDIKSRFLAGFAWFTRFKWIVARGGDQGLFVTRTCFDEIGHYDDQLQIMEDIDICRKLLKRKSFTILRPQITTSARKYHRVGIVKLQTLFIFITAMYWLGFSSDFLHRFYAKFIG